MRKKYAPSTSSKANLSQAGEFRQRAEALHSKLNFQESLPQTQTDLKRLVHELQVHQIELELQNQEQRRMQAELEASHRKYSDLFDYAPLGYLTLNKQGFILEANLTAAILLGVERNTLVQQALRVFIKPEDQDIFYLYCQTLFASGVLQICELRMMKKDADPFWARLQASLVQNAENGSNGCHIMLSDISINKQIEQELHLFKSLVENSEEAIAISDPTGKLIYINPAHHRLFGRSLEEAQKTNYRDYYPPESVNIIDCKVAPALARGESWEGEMDAFDADGRRFPLWEHAGSICDEQGNFRFGFGIMHDISQRKQAEEALLAANEQLQYHIAEGEQLQEELREQAMRDPLTGLFNRRYLYETLGHEIARASRENHTLGVIVTDIDHFKNFNDMYGHQAGDQILVEVARLMEQCTRESDLIYRYGGEEFLLILPGATLAFAGQRAEEIRQMCIENTLHYEGKGLSISMSFGVAAYPDHGKEADKIISKADKALYQSKERGRNRVTLWSEDQQQTS